MSSSFALPVSHDGGMDSSRPRSGGPKPRRSFTPSQKLEHVNAYEAACTHGGGGAYLGENGLYSSQVYEWRRTRDAGVLTGLKPGARIGKLTPEQAEIARLRRELDIATTRLAPAVVALEIVGKAHASLESLSKSTEAPTQDRR